MLQGLEKYKLQGVQRVLEANPHAAQHPASRAGLEAETNSFRLPLKTTLFSFIAELGGQERKMRGDCEERVVGLQHWCLFQRGNYRKKNKHSQPDLKVGACSFRALQGQGVCVCVC